MIIKWMMKRDIVLVPKVPLGMPHRKLRFPLENEPD